MYIRAEGASEEICYSDPYTDRIDVLQEQVEAIAGERCKIRYADVKQEAEDQIADGERQVEDARTQLSDARAQLDEGWQGYRRKGRPGRKQTAFGGWKSAASGGTAGSGGWEEPDGRQ